MDNITYQISQAEKLKDKHLNDINQHLKSRERYRIDKLNSEKEYNIYLRRLIAEEQEKNYFLKQHKINAEREEYNNYHMKKKLDENRQMHEKLRDKELLGLNVDYEANYKKHKEHIGMLDEKMEKNAILHSSFIMNNINGENHLSNMYKSLPYQDNYVPTSNTSLAIFPPNNINNSHSNPNKFYKEYKPLTKSDYEKNNEEDFTNYKNIKKSVNDYNKNLYEIKYKDSTVEERKFSDKIRLDDLKRQNQIEDDLKQLKHNQQLIYKNTLDKQNNERMFYSPQAIRIKNNYLGGNIDNIDHSFFDKNNPISVAPYNIKKYEIGGTILNHNPIINPVPDYKHNKYLFQNYSPFKYA